VWTPAARSLLLLTCLYTLLDCVKPLVIDDAAYSSYAHQAAEHPLDPYGFAVFWWQRPQPANDVLAPPVLPYWWSAAVRLFGESPGLWKLWLLPVSLLFVWALYALFRRFARGLELPLTWLTVLSPAFLPGLNLMLDVPAFALSLTAVVLFLRAADRDSPALAALAGLVAGLAMETKYTGFLAPAVMLIYAVLARKPGLWAAAVVPAVQVFVGWEFLMALLYGQSHFLDATRDPSSPAVEQKLGLWLPLLGILGSVAPAVALLGLAALRVRRRVLVLGGAVALLAYAATACMGGKVQIEEFLLFPVHKLPAETPMEALTFGLVGAAAVGIGTAVILRLAWPPGGRVPWVRRWRLYRDRWFLVLWLGLEIVGFFTLTPFPAARRVLGVVVVATLLAGRLASRTLRSRARVRVVYGLVAFSAALGLAFAALDWWEGWAEKTLAEQSAAEARARGAGTVWFVGHWGFQYYGERCGMRPVVPDYARYAGEVLYVPLPAPSRLEKGDWLVVPEWRLTQQRVEIDPQRTEEVLRLTVNDPVPLRTVMCYYSGTTALEHRPKKPRLEVTLYRVTEDFVPGP
jgi:hypothetical protein